MAEPTKPLVIVRPAPQSVERIFTVEALEALRAAYEVHILDEEPGVQERFDALLPRAFAVVGQPDLPTERLARATELRALLNVEGNFFPNVDYADLLRPRHPRPGLRTRLRHGRGRVRAGARPRPGPRHLAGRTGPSAPGGNATSRPPPPTRSCSPARRSGWSVSATWAGRCTGCCSRSGPHSRSTTRGCPIG